MRTLFLPKLAGLFALLLSAFLPVTEASAQIVNPYPVTNSMPCQVRIRYEIFQEDADGNCTNVVCAAATMLIPPGVTNLIPVPPYPCGCGIRICVVGFAGVPVVPPICNTWTSTTPPPPPVCGPSPSPCSPSGQICVDVQQTGANIQP